MEKQNIEKVILGIMKVTNIIERTLGPNGRNVIIHNGINPVIINDGASIIQNISFDDEYENIGALLMKQVSSTVDDKVGDGTTSAIIIANAIITSGFQLMKNGISYLEIRKGIEESILIIVDEIKKRSTKVSNKEQIYKLAYTSTKSQSLAKIIKKVFTISKNNIIEIEEKLGDHTTIEFLNGFIYEKGIINRFMLNGKLQVKLNNPKVYILNYEIQYKDIETIDFGIDDIMLIVQKVDNSIIQKIMVRNLNSDNKIYVALFMNNINIVDEIRKYINSKIINNHIELSNYINNNDCMANIVIINMERIVFINKSQKSKRRKVALIKLGALSEIELNDKKLRLSDAINSTQNALNEGYICGGGVCLYEIAMTLEKNMINCPNEIKHGLGVIIEAIKQPFYSIGKNSGYTINYLINQKNKLKQDYGLNAIENKWEDLKQNGIIDATNVVITEIKVASEVAKMILSSDYVISRKNKIYNDSIFPI